MPKLSPLIFLHIPKAGGTTFNDILKREFRFKKIYSLKYNDVEDFKKLSSDKHKKISLLKGHFPFGLHSYFENPHYVTFLRNPISRFISYYNYLLKTPRHYLYERVALSKMSMLDFVQSDLTVEIDNCQLRYLTGTSDPINTLTNSLLEEAKINLTSYFEIGITERFDESVISIINRLDWKSKPYYVQKNKARTTKKETIDPAIIKIITERNKLDIELYNWAQAQLNLRIKNIPEFDSKLKEFKINNQRYSKLMDNSLFKTIRNLEVDIKSAIKQITK